MLIRRVGFQAGPPLSPSLLDLLSFSKGLTGSFRWIFSRSSSTCGCACGVKTSMNSTWIVQFNSTLCSTTFTLAGCVVKRRHLEHI